MCITNQACSRMGPLKATCDKIDGLANGAGCSQQCPMAFHSLCAARDGVWHTGEHCPIMLQTPHGAAHAWHGLGELAEKAAR